MRSEGDDDALSWDGDDALEARRPETRKPAAPASPEPVVPADPEPSAPHSATGAATAATDATAPTAVASAEDAGEPQAISTVTLLLLGVLGGIYLLYTIGWVLGGVGMQLPVTFTLPAFLYQGALWLAVLAPALWFITVLVATRGARSWVRLVWLIAGAVLLIPWPFVVFGGGGVL